MQHSFEVTFGELFKQHRQKLGLTLRRFCEANEYDASNISKLERGAVPAPSKHEIVEDYARNLDLLYGSPPWQQFMDAAAASAGRIPDDLMVESDFVKKLPLVFRSLRKGAVTEEELEEVIRMFRDA